MAGSAIVRRDLSSRNETTGCAASSAPTSEPNRPFSELCVDEGDERGGRVRHGVDQVVHDRAFRDVDLRRR